MMYETERLLLNEISLEDSAMMKELVNTQEWIRFIGDRNIKTEDEAKNYIQKIIGNPNINYWIVKLKTNNLKLGIVTFIKRDYLEHHDIGFAFLPQYAQQGYAFEASTIVLKDKLAKNKSCKILATTIKENKNSIKLLSKLGFSFEKEMQVGNDLLLVYAVTYDKSINTNSIICGTENTKNIS